MKFRGIGMLYQVLNVGKDRISEKGSVSIRNRRFAIGGHKWVLY